MNSFLFSLRWGTETEDSANRTSFDSWLHVWASRLTHSSLSFSYSKGIQTPGRHVRTRLYFTSESHVHSLLTAIRYGGLLDVSDTCPKRLNSSFVSFLVDVQRWTVETIDGVSWYGVGTELSHADCHHALRRSQRRRKLRKTFPCGIALLTRCLRMLWCSAGGRSIDVHDCFLLHCFF